MGLAIVYPDSAVSLLFEEILLFSHSDSGKLLKILRLASLTVSSIQDEDPFAVFLALSHLPHLEEILRLPLTFAQLRVLRLQRHRWRSMPQLKSIRRANILLFNHTIETFLAEELFNDLLPLLPAVFCGLEHLDIFVVNYNTSREISQYETHRRQQLSTRARELFQGLRHCSARW